MQADYVGELKRLNTRYEMVKSNPNWDEAMLQILITAQWDLAEMIRKYDFEELS